MKKRDLSIIVTLLVFIINMHIIFSATRHIHTCMKPFPFSMLVSSTPTVRSSIRRFKTIHRRGTDYLRKSYVRKAKTAVIFMVPSRALARVHRELSMVSEASARLS